LTSGGGGTLILIDYALHRSRWSVPFSLRPLFILIVARLVNELTKIGIRQTLSLTGKFSGAGPSKNQNRQK
jgi:hypothetical protein